ncbi:uncharacterized protein N7483_001649 [Penicillium malachiteum]|uniref:uncharacterized protein n=1 Tax=Penicillium malachiteum TaxID=1324776 RepID=UPI002547B11A|nr:uncharacterized protein N7483_001649 [Penicillium malachiteum]KAJ5736524.1 hypothetical protein N7483_001649 [Penicillium malachiteum]
MENDQLTAYLQALEFKLQQGEVWKPESYGYQFICLNNKGEYWPGKPGNPVLFKLTAQVPN